MKNATTAFFNELLGQAAQREVALKSLTLFGAILATVAAILSLRSRVERSAGPAILKFERQSSRVASWLIAAALCGWYVMTVHADAAAVRPGVFPGSPLALFFAINFLVVRVWWRIDPAGIEARDEGLIIGGFELVPWSEMTRYTWSDTPPRRLNLFLRQRTVRNLKVDAEFAPLLGEILDAHLSV